MTNCPMEMSDFTWQHQKYARPEIYVVTYVAFIKVFVASTILKKKIIHNFTAYVSVTMQFLAGEK